MHTPSIISFCRLADGPSKTLVPQFQIGDKVTWEAAGEQPWHGLVVEEVHAVRNSCPHIRITARCGHRMAEGCQRFFRLDEIPVRIGAFDLDAETDF
jgi:hypothetical protein